MEFRIFCQNDDGSTIHSANVEASSANEAIDTFCDKFRVNDHGFIALAPGEYLPERPMAEPKFNIEGIDYDFE